MKYLNLILLSSTWPLNHRKGLHSELNFKLSQWSSVVFIESPYSLLIHTFIKFKSRVLDKIRDRKTADNIKTFTPAIFFHSKFWNKIPGTLQIDSWLMHLQLKKFINKNYPGQELIVWADFPFNFPFISKLNKRLLVYDFYDNYSYDANGNFNPLKDKYNKMMVAKSDLIFCTGQTMYNYAKTLNSETYYLPNGHSMKIGDPHTGNNRLKIIGKVIGYIGNIRDWIDFELLRDLVKYLKSDEYLIMIGPVEKNVSKEINILMQNKQFKYFGAVEYKEIFSYIKRFDIGIIPFKVNQFTEGVLPYKFFEYIASDIKIVSTPLPELIQFKNVINVAADKCEFIKLCTGEINKLKKDNIQYAKITEESTWDKRSEFIVSKLKEKLDI